MISPVASEIKVNRVAVHFEQPAFASPLVPSICVLPRITGEGLTPSELSRVQAARRESIIAVMKANPRVTVAEVDQVAVVAAKAELKHVLVERPCVSGTPAPTPCCGSHEDQPCLGCLKGDDAPSPETLEPEPEFMADGPESWPDWTDQRWELGPETDRLTFHELVSREARRLRAMGNDAGRLMADLLDNLAGEIRSLRAKTPAEFEARSEVMGLKSLSLAWQFGEDEAELLPSGQWS